MLILTRLFTIKKYIMEKIYDELAELLEVDLVKDDDVLDEFECWDSLTVLSIIALASESYRENSFSKRCEGGSNYR